MKLSAAEVKRQDKRMIYRYILKYDDKTKPEISAALRLSTPTVGKITNELLEAKLITETGTQASSGGRKAVMLKAEANAKFALGIEVTKNHVGFAIVNLKGEIIDCLRIRKPFYMDAQYAREVFDVGQQFLSQHHLEMDMLTGIGVALPGIIDKEQKHLYYARILEIKESVELKIPDYIGVPVRYFTESTAACMAEMYSPHAPESFTYLSLSDSVGGAYVYNNQIVDGNSGKNGRNGEIGHVCIVPNGKKCYCGKRGHYTAYGSALVLSDLADGKLETFFERVAEGDPYFQEELDKYLDYLALLLCNIETTTNQPIIIGGYVGSFLEPYFHILKEKVSEHYIFELADDYLCLCNYKTEAAAVGSALYFIDSFIQDI